MSNRSEVRTALAEPAVAPAARGADAFVVSTTPPQIGVANAPNNDNAIRGRSLKRALDVVGGLGLFVFFMPLMAVIYVLVRIDRGPGIFAHERIGRNGKTFKCYKFRSMVPNAQEVLNDILASDDRIRRAWEAEHKLEDDPRITKIGAFLRRKSLDELPQLLNVLKGDMSLVGPRPITSDEIWRYGDNIRDYYSVRPGLTGAWQVSGRNDVSYSERVDLDVDYAKEASFAKDITILLKTVGVVISGRGAR